jgi:hypothetical protein
MIGNNKNNSGAVFRISKGMNVHDCVKLQIDIFNSLYCLRHKNFKDTFKNKNYSS